MQLVLLIIFRKFECVAYREVLFRYSKQKTFEKTFLIIAANEYNLESFYFLTIFTVHLILNELHLGIFSLFLKKKYEHT